MIARYILSISKAYLRQILSKSKAHYLREFSGKSWVSKYISVVSQLDVGLMSSISEVYLRRILSVSQVYIRNFSSLSS